MKWCYRKDKTDERQDRFGPVSWAAQGCCSCRPKETTEVDKMAPLPVVVYFDQHFGCCCTLQTLFTSEIKVLPINQKWPKFTVLHTFLYVKHVFRFPGIEEGDPQKGHCTPSSCRWCNLAPWSKPIELGDLPALNCHAMLKTKKY